jgi:M6 family metalloprotease-like protein
MDWRTTDNTEAFFAGGVSGKKSGGEMQSIFTPILQQLENEDWFSFDPYDSDKDGVLDHLVVLTSGYGAELGVPPDGCDLNQPADRVWSQGFPTISDGWTSSKSGMKLDTFALTSAFDDGLCQSKSAEMGLILHEYIHGFYLPDLYDTDLDDTYLPTGGTGSFDILSSQYGWYVFSTKMC